MSEVDKMSEPKLSLYQTLLKTIRRRCVRANVYCPICKETHDVLVKHSNEKLPKRIWVMCGYCGCKGFVTLKEPNRISSQISLVRLF